MSPKMNATRSKRNKPIKPQLIAPIIAMVNAVPSKILLPIFILISAKRLLSVFCFVCIYSSMNPMQYQFLQIHIIYALKNFYKSPGMFMGINCGIIQSFRFSLTKGKEKRIILKYKLYQCIQWIKEEEL